MASIQSSFTARVLEGAAALASTAWPVMEQLLPERLEFDDTQSIWHAGTPEYQSRAPLSGSITADLAIIGKPGKRAPSQFLPLSRGERRRGKHA